MLRIKITEDTKCIDMREISIMKKYYFIIAVLLIAMTFTGCSAVKNIIKVQEENQENQTETVSSETEPGTSKDDNPEDTEVSEPEEDFSPIHHAYESKGIYAVDNKNIYFVSNNVIYRVNRETDELSILAAILGGSRGDLGFYMTNVLYSDGNYLYYLQRYDAETGRYGAIRSLWKIDKRDGDYQELSLPVVDGSIEEFFVINHTIYFKYGNTVEDETYGSRYEENDICYTLTEDGDIGEEITGSSEDLYELLPDGYKYAYAISMGSYLYNPYQETHILQRTDSYDYALYNSKTLQTQYLFSGSYSIRFFDGVNLIYSLTNYDTEESRTLTYYKNVLTGEDYQIADDACNIIGANEEEIYYFKVLSENERGVATGYAFYRLFFQDMCEGAEGEVVFRQEQSHQIRNNLSVTIYSFVTTAPGDVYFIGGETDELDFIRYTVGDVEESYKNCGVLEVSKIKDVGEYTSDANIFYCPNCNEVELEYYIESFHMQGGRAGDAAINTALEEDMTTSANYAIDTFTNEDCEFHQDESFSGSCNFLDVTIDVSYVSDDYIGFLWNGYEYYRGAAHGMPYQYFGLFDRNTGEELRIGDILATPQEEFNSIIFQKFSENFAAYADAMDMDYISEYGGYFTDNQFHGGGYYLTEVGLVYYFEAYEVTSYSMGMPSVVIPYEELDWKVDLWK